MEFKLKSVSNLTEELQNKMEFFRKTTSTMSGRVRTEEEAGIHNDKYCSNSDIIRWILVLKNEEIVGAAAIFLRDVTFNDYQVSLGGIGQVRVREDKRRMGLASKMMCSAMDELEKTNCDVAYLCTDMESFLVTFYEKFGFVKMNQPYTYLSKSGKRHTEKEGMLAPIKSNEIFEEVMNDGKPFDIGIGNW